MAYTDREKRAKKALRHLYPFLIENLTPNIRHELYAKDMLTWQEQQTIGECSHTLSATPPEFLEGNPVCDHILSSGYSAFI